MGRPSTNIQSASAVQPVISKNESLLILLLLNVMKVNRNLRWMSCLVSGLAICASTLAQTQVSTLSPEEQLIQTSYVNLSAQPNLFFDLKGTEKVGSVSYEFEDALYWSMTSPQPTLNVNVELQQRVNVNSYIRRVVADGSRLYAYEFNLTPPAYAVADYSVAGSPAVPNYLVNLLGLLNDESRGQSTYIVRLLRDVFLGNPAPTYRTWAPGYTPLQVPAYTDPISGASYSGVLKTYVVLRPLDPNPAKCIGYELTQGGDSQPYNLTAIHYSEQSGTGPKMKILTWDMYIYPGFSNFQAPVFTPMTVDQLTGWRPIVFPRSIKVKTLN